MKIAIVLTILFLSTSVFTIISIPMGVSSTSTQSTLIKANYPIKIIQPQPNLNIKNRFYKAYPGIDYDVRIAVTGGEYPFTYSLTKSPTGMIINKDTGEISWANPTVSNSPYAVSAKVVGKNGASTSVQPRPQPKSPSPPKKTPPANTPRPRTRPTPRWQNP